MPAKKKPVATAKKPAAKAARSPGGAWLPQFETMVAELRANKKVQAVVATIPPPATDAQIAKAERRFGRPIDPEIVAFYREMNGFDLEWENRLSEDDNGHIHIQPIEKVFGDWKDVMWFEQPGGDKFRSLLPFDFFVPEACMAFDATETPLRVHFHYCGEERSATGYGFAEYLERLLASRGYFYWVETLCEDDDRSESSQAESFLANVHRLFRGVDKRLFRPKKVDFSTLSLDELIARVKTDDDDEDENEAPKALAMEIQSRPSSEAFVRDLLLGPSPERRIQALKVLAHYGLKALPLLGPILRAQLGLPAGTSKEADTAIDLAASSIFHAINSSTAGGAAKAVAAGVKELQKETDVRPVALLLGSNSTKAVDPTGHFFDVAVKALKDGVHAEEGAKVVSVLEKQEEAAQILLREARDDAKLAVCISSLQPLYDLSPETTTRVRALLEASLHHRSEPVAIAAVLHLLINCEEEEYAKLGLFTHPSAAVREALVRELVSWMAGRGRHEKEKRLLAMVAANEREDAGIREIARRALT